MNVNEQSFNWAGLTHEFKMEAVKLLNVEAKSNLQLCSKSDKEIVDFAPVHYHRVKLSVPNEGPEIEIKKVVREMNERTIEYNEVVDRKEDGERVWAKKTEIEMRKETFANVNNYGCNEVDKFLDIFRNRQTTVKVLKIKNDNTMQCFLSYVLDRIRELESNNKKLTMKVSVLYWKGAFTKNDSAILDLLENYFEAPLLTNFIIEGNDFDKECLDRLMSGKHWKNFIEFNCQPKISMRVDDILYLEEVNISKDSINAEDVVKLIKNLYSEEKRYNSYFLVRTKKYNMERLKVEVESLLQYVIPMQFVDSTTLRGKILKFPYKDPNYAMLVNFDGNSVFGQKIETERIDDDPTCVYSTLCTRQYMYDFPRYARFSR